MTLKEKIKTFEEALENAKKVAEKAFEDYQKSLKVIAHIEAHLQFLRGQLPI